MLLVQVWAVLLVQVWEPVMKISETRTFSSFAREQRHMAELVLSACKPALQNKRV